MAIANDRIVQDVHQLPDVQSVEWLVRIHDELIKLNAHNEPADPPGIFNTPVTTHVRLRMLKVIFACSAACTIAFTIGTRTFTFFSAGAGQVVVDFPYVIPRGTDVTAVPSAGTLDGYIIADVE